ncbi:DDB1- and CUL4-associated factor 8 [Anopheles bellator]|uniref:DDB1- and CUL4-associated factor 8 n=1 Tax=Anopheles bellator TaxID=139047 RepID=UPI002648AC1F|nr:DDB1- and CUL4-associated factor 8 [Anopheles bellator]XP_058057889.1 DDB1- and CUL4-associated factor 8 [Anopheles bellator]
MEDESSSKGDGSVPDDASPPKKSRVVEQMPELPGTSQSPSTSSSHKNELVAKQNSDQDPSNGGNEAEASPSSTATTPVAPNGHQHVVATAPLSTESNSDASDRSPAGDSSTSETSEKHQNLNSLQRLWASRRKQSLNLDRNDDGGSSTSRINDVLEYFSRDVPDLLRGSDHEDEDDDDTEDGDDLIPAEEILGDRLLLDSDESSGDDSDHSSSSSSFSASSSSSFLQEGARSASSGSRRSSESMDEDIATRNAKLEDEIMASLQTAKMKSKWNVLRDLEQRQRFGTAAAGVPGTSRYCRANSMFTKRAYGSLDLVQRLQLSHYLRGHEGCVNSLNFNATGTMLASGSDDLQINLWSWHTNKLLKSITTGHQLNVFQTKFIEYGGYGSEIEIISTGRDGHVRHTRVDPSGGSNTQLLYRCHQAIHKVAIPASNECAFLTAGEDGKVRMYDLRHGTVDTLLNLRLRLFSIATHPFDPHFCVSGNDGLVRMYDQRHVRRPIKQFTSLQLPKNCRSKNSFVSITSAVYNHLGTEVLASYSEDAVYLFDNTTMDAVVKPAARYGGHCNIQTIKGVNFFGQRSEYVVSGSDCGHIFFWDKKTQNIVNWLRSGKHDVINCLEPHPEYPILATSGLSHVVKMWVPKGVNDEQTVPLWEPKDLRRNVRENFASSKVNWQHFRRTGFTRNMMTTAFQRRGAIRRPHARGNDAAVAYDVVENDNDSDSDSSDDGAEPNDLVSFLHCRPS